MDIIDFVPIINELKRNKASKLTIDNTAYEQLNMTYKNWRKKINELGYTCINNQFIKVGINTENTENKELIYNEIDIIKPAETPKRVNITLEKDLFEKEKELIYKEMDLLKGEINTMKNEIIELREMISEPKPVEPIIEPKPVKRVKRKTIGEIAELTDITQKSVRVSENLFNQFVTMCKENNIKKVNAFNKAIELFLDKYKN